MQDHGEPGIARGRQSRFRDRVWNAAVPDPQDGATTATIRLGGELVHTWSILDQAIVPADGSAPQSLFGEFAPWAQARFSGDALEGATILRMAAFTARARAHIPETQPWPLADFPERLQACHAYSPPQQGTAAQRLDVVRDFSAGVEAPVLPRIKAKAAPPPPRKCLHIGQGRPGSLRSGALHTTRCLVSRCRSAAMGHRRPEPALPSS